MINLKPFETDPPARRLTGGCADCGSGRVLSQAGRCGNGLEKIYPTTAVRFGYMRYIGEFTYGPEVRFTCGGKVVIQTQRGIEIGEQVSLTCGGCDKAVTRAQMKEWVQRCGDDTYMFNAGRILREATAADLAENAHIQQSTRQKRDFARQVARRHNLPIRVVECEYLFGGERIIFHFTAEERVDFRGMVKDLAREYRTRIEMRQIGARDEARLLADYETCGREVCCKTLLKTLKPISMRMAKLQKATLDPAQVSGRCGRLKCCLRYEHTGYEELDKRLPRVGVRIRTRHGEGTVVKRQILTQLVQIRNEDGVLTTVVIEDVIDPNAHAEPASRPSPRPSPRPAKAPPAPGKPADRRSPTLRAKRRPSRTEGTRAEDAGPPPASPQAGQRSDEPPTRHRRRRRRRRRRGGGSAGGASSPNR